jgi:hypothetical protein
MAMGSRCESRRPLTETEPWTLRTTSSKKSLATAKVSQRMTPTAKSYESNEGIATTTCSARLILTTRARN